MELKAIFKRCLPQQGQIYNYKHHKHLRWLGQRLYDPEIWHLNRRSAAGGVAIGLFVAFVPLPIHLILAAGAAIIFRVNMPISVLFVWVSNPLTWAPQTILTYKTGAWLMGVPPNSIPFEFSMDWFTDAVNKGWQPFLLGSVVLGALSAVLGGLSVRLLWRLHLVKKWKARRSRRTRKPS